MNKDLKKKGFEMHKEKRRRVEKEKIVDVVKNAFNVKPIGNALIENAGEDARESLGYLSFLTDPMIFVSISLLDFCDVIALSSTCKFLYVLTQTEEIWRDQCFG